MPFRADRHEPLPADKAEIWNNFLSWPGVTYFPNVVGLELEEVRQDYARLRLPYRPELIQPAGVVHGGALATLVDTVVVPAVGWAYDEFRPMLTLDMNISYLSAVHEQDAIAEGWIRKRGRSIVFCEVDLWNEAGDICATGSLTYKVGKPVEPPPGVVR